jgi:CheY-like chemotaxis protein
MSQGAGSSSPQRASSPVVHRSAPPEPRRVLVIDDGEEARDLYCECLEFHGFRADSAEDGASGLAKAAATTPDVIVLDFSMPRMDGGEVLQRLRASERTRRIPVIMVTAVLELVDPKVRARCAAFLEKPCEPERLVQTIDEVLDASDDRDVDAT